MRTDYGICPTDPRCIHGSACRYERCSKCGKTWHVLGAYMGSACCDARLVPAQVSDTSTQASTPTSMTTPTAQEPRP